MLDLWRKIELNFHTVLPEILRMFTISKLSAVKYIKVKLQPCGRRTLRLP